MNLELTIHFLCIVCVGGIQSNGGNPPQVYGDILFQVYYFVFNYETKQLGFAPHA